MANGNDRLTPTFLGEEEEQENGQQPALDVEQDTVQTISPTFEDEQDEEPDRGPTFDEERSLSVTPTFEQEEQQNQFGVQSPEQKDVSPWDFSEQTVGEPWQRGWKNMITFATQAGQMLADWRDGIKRNVRGGIDAVFGEDTAAGDVAEFLLLPEAALGFDSVNAATEQLRQYSNSIHARPSNLPPTEIQSFQDFLDTPSNALEFLEPNRIWQTFGENAPTTGAFLLATAVNPKLGATLAVGLEGGDAHATLKAYEERTGEDIPLAGEIAIDLGVGTIAGSMEYLGLKRIEKVAKGVGNSTFKRTLFNMVAGALAEGTTEGGQEVTQALGEATYLGTIPDGLEQRFIQSVYAGIVTGGGLSSANALMGSIAQTRPGDATIDHWIDPQEGRMEPIFRINKPGHEMEGQLVTLEQMDSITDINTPWYQADRLEKEIVRNLPENMENKEMVARETRVLGEVRARSAGYENFSEYVRDHNVQVKRGRIEQGDLLQEEMFHGSPHDFDKFSTQHIGTGEGFQAYGWGLYFTESRGTAEQYAATLGGAGRNLHNSILYKGKGYASPSRLARAVAPLIDATLDGMDANTRWFFETGVNKDIQLLLNESVDSNLNIDSDQFNSTKEELIQRRQDHIEQLKQEMVTEPQRGDFDTIADSVTALEAEISFLQKLNPNDVTANNPSGGVYKIRHIDRKDFDDLTWLNWRDEVSNEDIRSVQDELLRQERQARDKGNIDLVEKIQDARRRFEEVVGGARPPAGSRVYGALSTAFDSPRIASIFLNQAGFDGTRYRGDAGRAEYANHVIFDESIIEIEQKDVLFQQEGKTPKGAINFSDGQRVIKFFNSADPSTVLHEMAHLFRRDMLTQEELQVAEDVFDVGQEGWTREHEEAFARGFEKWMSRGEAPNSKLTSIFRRFREWLLDVYGTSIGRGLGGELTGEQIQFFNSLFEHVNEDINALRNGPKKTSILGSWVERVSDWLDIEGRFVRNLMPETGFHAKSIFSTRSMYEQEGVDMVEKYYQNVKIDSDQDAEAVLLAEQRSQIDRIRNKPEGERSEVEKAALILREYMDRSQEEYNMRGIPVGFKERLVSEVEEKMRDLDGQDRERMKELLDQLNEASDIEFVHIPFYAWFRDKIDKSPKEATQLLTRMVSRQFIGIEATRHERLTPQIQDLIDEGLIDASEINAREIIQSYSRQKGKDFALSNLRNAAIKEEAAIPVLGKEAPPPGYKRGVEGAPLFKDYFVKDILHFYIRDQIMEGSSLGRIRKWINISKMAAFWNPLFLPMYDIIQSHMAGTMNILRPVRTIRQVTNAFSSVMNMDQDFWDAEEHGISSKPFNDPLATSDLQTSIAARTRHSPESGTFGKTMSWVLARGEAAFNDVIQSAIDSPLKEVFGAKAALRNVYEASWATAWFLDRTVRQVTYEQFRQDGFGKREAAQKAAQAHADYASIPPKTRKTLNSIFFTPTFKIAMGKWMLDSIRSLGNVLSGEATISQKQAAGVFIKGVAILGAFDMMMLALGFDRDEWGRRYQRSTDTSTGQKELVINWTGPHNLFLKYLQRIEEVMGPEVPNPITRAYSVMEWEITPLFRTTAQVAQNDKGGGEKIYYVGDDAITKVGKSLQYGSLEIIQLLKQMSEEEKFGKEGAEQFAKEYGQFLEVVTAPFLFKYTRATAPERLQSKLQALLSIHQEEVEGAWLANQMLRAGNDPQKVVDDYINGRGVFSSTAQERSENLVKRMQELIWEFEEDNYDIWDEEQGSTVRPSFDQ